MGTENFAGMKKLITTGLILQLTVIMGCKTTEVKEIKKESMVPEITVNYAEYNVLNAVFTIEGQLSGKDFRYPGKIRYKKSARTNLPDITITVSDPVFLSSLTTITIDGENLFYRDFINNRSETLPYRNSSIIFFSNFPLPSDVIIPVLMGQLPPDFIETGKKNNDGKSYRVFHSDFEIIGYFRDNKMHSMILNPAEQFNQITFSFEGSVENKLKRYFPESVFIEFSKGDHLRLIYNSVVLE